MSSILSIIKYGLSVSLVGISTVFVGLIILIALIKILEIVMGSVNGRKKPEEAPAAVSEAPVVEEIVEEEDDGELVAVIAAAVAAILEAEGEETGFVVRSIRRINNAPAWNRAGREEQVYSRL